MKPLRCNRDIYEAIVTAMKYPNETFGRPTAVLHYENAKEYKSAAVYDATPALRTSNRITIPYNIEDNVFVK